MAHTFLYQPSNPAPCLNDVDYQIQAEDSGAGTYTARVDLQGDNFNTIQLFYTLDSNRRFWLKLKEILKANAPIQFVNGVGKADARAFSYPGLFGYALDIYIFKNGAQQGIALEANDKKYIRAGLDYTKFITNTWANHLLGLRYTSILPKKRTVQLDEYFCISAYLPSIPEGFINFEFYVYKADGTLISGGHGDGYALISFNFDHNIVNLMTMFNELNQNPSWGNIFANLSQVAYFDVFIRDVDTGARYSQTDGCFRYYVKQKDNLYSLRSFLFRNSLGGYDVLTFSGEKISMTEQEKQEADIYYPANYLIGQPQTVEYNQQRKEEYKINSGFISTAEWLAAYQDFIHSEDIYEMVNIGSKDAALPIKLNKAKFKLGQDNQTNQSLDIEYSYRFENFGFTNLLKI